MKTRVCSLRLLEGAIVAMGCATLLQQAASAAEPTALDLFRQGDQYVGAEARGRLIKITSEKSIGSVTPSIWSVTYFDPNAAGKATEVRFNAGQKAWVKYHGSFLGLAKAPRELPKGKVLVDSDAALRTATVEPLLKNLNLKATRMILEDWQGMPTWKVQIWAARLSNPAEMAEVGEVFISGEDGKVLRSDLKIKKVD
jgi:hypothetical protein